MKKRVIAFLLTMAMLLGVCPVLATDSITYTDGVKGWDATESIKDGTEHSYKFQTVTGMGHNDDSCMYAEFQSDAPTNGTWGFSNDTLLLTNEYTGYESGSNYTFSMWVKGTAEFASSIHMSMGWTTTVGENRNKYNVAVTGKNQDANFEDWTQVSVTMYGAVESLKIRIQTNAALYIDDVSLIKEGTTTNLLTNGAIAPTATPTPEPTVTAAPSDVTYTDGVEGWSSREVIKNGTEHSYKFQTATGVGRTDNTSMYIEFASNAPNNTTWGYSNDALEISNSYTAFDANKTYTLTMWIKGKVGFANSAYVKMGWNQSGKNGYTDADANQFQISAVDGQIKNAVYEDWTQVSFTFHTPQEKFRLWFQTEVSELYIDDITLVADDAPTINLLTNGAIAPAATPTPAPTPTATPEPTPTAAPSGITYIDGVEGWYTEQDSRGTSTVNSNKLQTVTGMGHNSDTCMYLEYNTEAAENQYGYSTNDAIVLYNDTATFDTSKTYTVSMWIKGDISYTTTAYLWMGDTNGGNSTAIANKFQFNKFLSGDYQNVSLADWTQITATITAPTKRFALRFQCDVPGLYIDDVTLTESGSTTNLLANGDLETIPEKEMRVTYTDGVDGWTCVPNSTTADVLTQKFQTVTGMGHDSYSCMYVEFDSAAADNSTWGYSSDTFLLTNAYDGYDANKTYTLTMWIKGVTAFSNSVFIQMGGTKMGNSASDTGMHKWKLSTLTNTQINATFADWTKVVFDIDNPTQALQIRFQCDVPGFYIDDVSLVADDAPTVNLLTNGSFDKINEEGFYAYKARIYDGDTEVTALSTQESGKTLTAEAVVYNYTYTGSTTAQLITCLYDDEHLVKVVLSEKIDIPAAGKGKVLSNEITLPTFSEVGDLTVKTYIWDSIQGMIPLQDEVGQI